MKKYIFFALFLFFPAFVFAADTVYFGVKPPEKQLKFADEFSVMMEVTYPSQYQVVPDTASVSEYKFFDLLSFDKTGDASSGTAKTDFWTIKAQAFDIGVSTFPSITWQLKDGGKTVSEASSPQFHIKVTPLFKPETVEKSDIRDVYPPIRFPNWLLIFLASIAAAAFIYYIYRKATEKKGGIAVFGKKPWEDLRTPYQRAYDRTSVLENSSLIKSGKAKEFYTGLVSVFRFYLHEEFGIDAETFTTKDLAREMKNANIGVRNISKARTFLNRADMVKFAKMRPENCTADLQMMRDLLQLIDMEHTPVVSEYEDSYTDGYVNEPSGDAYQNPPPPPMGNYRGKDTDSSSSVGNSRWMPPGMKTQPGSGMTRNSGESDYDGSDNGGRK